MWFSRNITSPCLGWILKNGILHSYINYRGRIKASISFTWNSLWRLLFFLNILLIQCILRPLCFNWSINTLLILSLYNVISTQVSCLTCMLNGIILRIINILTSWSKSLLLTRNQMMLIGFISNSSSIYSICLLRFLLNRILRLILGNILLPKRIFSLFMRMWLLIWKKFV